MKILNFYKRCKENASNAIINDALNEREIWLYKPYQGMTQIQIKKHRISVKIGLLILKAESLVRGTRWI